MATAPVKPPLHNFPPTFFKWGSKSNTPHRSFRRSPSTPERPPPEDEERESARKVTAEPEPEPEPEEEKPCWNLRPRRTSAFSSTAKLNSPEVAAENLPKSMRLREGGGGGGLGLGERREKRKFWIALSKEEIEEDIYALTGSKPSRRPKRRPKNVQKQLDNLFPGLWLVGLSAEAYRNLDVPSNR